MNRQSLIREKFWIDTNIIIRFITNDHPKMTPEVAKLMEQAENGHILLKVSPIVIAECCWVLQSSHYHYNPSDIANVLTSFILANGIEMEEQDIVVHALDRYATTQVDFVDAYLAALSKNTDNQPIITNNSKDFQKLNVPHIQPTEVRGL